MSRPTISQTEAALEIFGNLPGPYRVVRFADNGRSFYMRADGKQTPSYALAAEFATVLDAVAAADTRGWIFGAYSLSRQVSSGRVTS